MSQEMDETASSDSPSLPPKRKVLNIYWIKRFTVFLNFLVVDLRLLMRLCVKIVVQWRSIGVQLGVPGHELNNIQANNRGDPHMVQNCLSCVFDWWLKNERDITPEKLAQAIHIVGEHEVEAEIKQKFGKYSTKFPCINLYANTCRSVT
jgi:hypothetical protein